MKKILVLLLILLSSSCVFSQVRVDKFDEDGSRLIISKRKLIKASLKVGLTFRLTDYVEVNGADKYSLLLTIENHKKREYSKGRKLLIKMKDDSIIELINKKTVGVNDYHTGLSKFIDIDYSIQENDIEKIINGKIVKLRIENDFDYIDVEIKKDLFETGLKEAYDAIQERKKIDKKIGNEGLYEGF